MENFEGYLGKIATSILRVGQKNDTKIQLIVRPHRTPVSSLPLIVYRPQTTLAGSGSQ